MSAATTSQRGLLENITPHRSYRRLPVSSGGALVTLPIVLLVELTVFFGAQPALNAMTGFASLVAGREGIAARVFPDPFLFMTTHPMTFAMRSSDRLELGIVLVACIAVVTALSMWTAIAAPVRFFVNLNLLLIAGAAVSVLVAGKAGYDSTAFSQLMVRTALFTWFIMPVFVGLLAALFPFTIPQRLGFVALTVAYDVPLSIVRYGLFVAILGKTSSIAMTDLYLVFGPLLDALPVICFFSIFLARVARSLEGRRMVWRWL